jgi:hypothetical protein
MEIDEVVRVHEDYFRKVCHSSMEPGTIALSDPATGAKQALRCDFEDLILKLAHNVRRRIVDPVIRIDHRNRVVKCTRVHHYDAMIVTLPLWELLPLVDFFVPESWTMRSNLIYITPRRDGLAGFDYVYTPYTPNGAVHRITPDQGGYCVEVSGELDRVDLHADLQFLFPDGYILNAVVEGLPGYILPVSKPAWPRCMQPLGRYASWDFSASMDSILSEALNLERQWSA